MTTKGLLKFGWLLFRKLIYYAACVLAIMLIFNWATTLMTLASTLAFIGGVALCVVGVVLAVLCVVREVLYYAGKLD